MMVPLNELCILNEWQYGRVGREIPILRFVEIA
jgi:hypothetical protein